MKKQKQIIGWREWVCLPDFGIDKIKAKVDTGARSSSIHATHIETFEKDGISYARFNICPVQRNSKTIVKCIAKITEFRKIRSSNGQSELRPVISTTIELLGSRWEIELTLTNRDDMGFRMLLGRESFRKKFLIDAGSSYHGKKLLGNKQSGREM